MFRSRGIRATPHRGLLSLPGHLDRVPKYVQPPVMKVAHQMNFATSMSAVQTATPSIAERAVLATAVHTDAVQTLVERFVLGAVVHKIAKEFSAADFVLGTIVRTVARVKIVRTDAVATDAQTDAPKSNVEVCALAIVVQKNAVEMDVVKPV